MEVKADTVLPSADPAKLWWEGDCVELFFNVLDDDGLTNVDTLQPGPKHGPDAMQIASRSNGVGSSNSYLNPLGHYLKGKRAAAHKTKAGYHLEIAIPVNSIPLHPSSGYSLGIRVRVIGNDAKRNIAVTTLPWTNVDHRDTTGWGRMKLG